MTFSLVLTKDISRSCSVVCKNYESENINVNTHTLRFVSLHNFGTGHYICTLFGLANNEGAQPYSNKQTNHHHGLFVTLCRAEHVARSLLSVHNYKHRQGATVTLKDIPYIFSVRSCKKIVSSSVFLLKLIPFYTLFS